MHVQDAKLSVIIPMYNALDFTKNIQENITKTLQRATRKAFRFILVDDGSKDASNAVIRALLKEFIDSGDVEIVEQPNHGALRARLSGARRCKTELCAFLDADDRLNEEFGDHLLEGLKRIRRSDITILDTYVQGIDRVKTKIDYYFQAPPKAALLMGAFPMWWGKIFKTSYLLEMAPKLEVCSLHYSEDDFVIRALAPQAKVDYMPVHFCDYIITQSVLDRQKQYLGETLLVNEQIDALYEDMGYKKRFNKYTVIPRLKNLVHYKNHSWISDEYYFAAMKALPPLSTLERNSWVRRFLKATGYSLSALLERKSILGAP